MAAASSEPVGGIMSFGLYYLRFADGGCVADPLLYSTSYLVSQLVGHHMSYEEGGILSMVKPECGNFR